MSSNEIELTPEESAYAKSLREEFDEAWDEAISGIIAQVDAAVVSAPPVVSNTTTISTGVVGSYTWACPEGFVQPLEHEPHPIKGEVTDDVLRRYTELLEAMNAIYGWPPYIGNDPGDEDTGRARDTGETDRDYVRNQAGEAEAQAETQARSDHLMDLAKKCDNDVMRDQAIDSLEGVVKSHEPPPPPEWVGNLSRFI